MPLYDGRRPSVQADADGLCANGRRRAIDVLGTAYVTAGRCGAQLRRKLPQQVASAAFPIAAGTTTGEDMTCRCTYRCDRLGQRRGQCRERCRCCHQTHGQVGAQTSDMASDCRHRADPMFLSRHGPRRGRGRVRHPKRRCWLWPSPAGTHPPIARSPQATAKLPMGSLSLRWS